MFKILTLKPGVDDDLQAIQNQWEIDAVENLGADSTFNHYLLVQYDTKPSPPLAAKKPDQVEIKPMPLITKKDDAKPIKGK